MNRTEKQELIDELHGEFKASRPRGPGGLQGAQRARGHRVPQEGGASGSRYRVVKNSLALRAVKDTPLEKLGAKFEGTTGVAYTGDDPVAWPRCSWTSPRTTPRSSSRAGSWREHGRAGRGGGEGPLHDARACPSSGPSSWASCRRPATQLVRLLGTPATQTGPGAEGAAGQARGQVGVFIRTDRLRKGVSREEEGTDG